ncbi:MAG: PocR ligand-binding domain-containing protein [Eubacteriales bacterium]|nr:PocR ligand-binding domain-containing protein [Eubacteriales bacterium]
MNSILFSFVPAQRIKSILETLHNYTDLTLRLLDPDGKLMMLIGENPNYCQKLNHFAFSASDCSTLQKKSAYQANRLGEAYIFTCHAGLNYIAYSIANRGEMLGSILIGPFLMDKPDSTLISTITDKFSITPAQALDLYDNSQDIPILSPDKTGYLSKLVNDLLMPLLPAERAILLQTHEKLYQQSRLNEAIQMYKGQDIPNSGSVLYEKEQLLLTKARTGNKQEVMDLLNDYLGYVLFSEGGKIEAVRTRAIELAILLSRISIEGGARPESIYELSSKFLSLISQEEDFEKVCFLLQDITENYMNAMTGSSHKGNPYIRHALQYIAANYSKPITVESAAQETGLSTNYFSKLFLDTVGISFREHLNRVRVEESKQLLLLTDYTMTDIALSVGFSDQSYFCRVFHRITGITPGQFRK